MSNMRRSSFLGLALLIGTMFWAGNARSADCDSNEDRDCGGDYSIASIRGDYAIVGVYGANVAGLLGLVKADGKGNVSGAAQVNLPGPNGQRILISLPFTGTYTVNPDGTGVFTLTVQQPQGGTQTVHEDFVITKVKTIRDENVAIEIADMQREYTPGPLEGQFATHVLTRRSNRQHDGKSAD